jgi:hypothetical protein
MIKYFTKRSSEFYSKILKGLLTMGLTIYCLSCSQDKKGENKSLERKIKICVVDSSDLADRFWKINRLLEKEHPEHFKNPPDYSDTTNEYYITHYLKRYRVTVGGTTTKLDKFCVAKSNTLKLSSLINNPNYNKFFSLNSYFAYGFEKNNCLDIYLLTNKSISFQKSDLTDFFLESGPYGPSIGVRLNSEAGKRLKDFSENNIGREVAFMIDGVIYSTANIRASLDNNVFAIRPSLTANEINNLFFSQK